MPDKPVAQPPRRVFLKVPRNWATMTDAEKQAAGLEMARALQRQLLPTASEPPKAG